MELPMTARTPTVEVDQATREALARLSAGDLSVLRLAEEMRAEERVSSGLDARTFALVKIAVLIALDAPPASYLWQIPNALEAGVAPESILGVLRAVASQVGMPKVVAAAPEIALALGLSLPGGEES
jgi:alkylhydroperoxidase/carboxymuconolactone decarboxylase family protein YurZ